MLKRMVLIGAIVALFGYANQVTAAEMIRYNGSSTILKAIMYKAAKEFEKQEGIKFDLKGKSTGFGIKKILAGECDIAGGGRPLSEDLKGKGLVATKLCLDAGVFMVQKDNPVETLSSQQITDILFGKLTHWDKVNGPAGKKIIIVSPPTKSSHYKNIKKKIGFNELPKNSIKIDMTPNVYKKVKAFPASIGWLSYSTVRGKKGVKILQIVDNGEKTEISQANISSGKYPYQQTMYFYTKGAPEGNVKKFVDFIQSEKGKAIISDAGFFLAEG